MIFLLTTYCVWRRIKQRERHSADVLIAFENFAIDTGPGNQLLNWIDKSEIYKFDFFVCEKTFANEFNCQKNFFKLGQSLNYLGKHIVKGVVELEALW